jgi:hypothetical protein
MQSPVENLEVIDGPFDAALAVNTVGMWPQPTARLREIGRQLRPGGRIALVSQPRCPGATAATSAAAGDRLAGQLLDAGFSILRVETLELDPPAVCVLATATSTRRRTGSRDRSPRRSPPKPRPRRIPALARTGYATEPLQHALAHHGIPHRVLGSLGLPERTEVHDALAYLTLLQNSRDAQAFGRAIASPRRGSARQRSRAWSPGRAIGTAVI